MTDEVAAHSSHITAIKFKQSFLPTLRITCLERVLQSRLSMHSGLEMFRHQVSAIWSLSFNKNTMKRVSLTFPNKHSISGGMSKYQKSQALEAIATHSKVQIEQMRDSNQSPCRSCSLWQKSFSSYTGQTRFSFF
jgi:hypothetical protein